MSQDRGQPIAGSRTLGVDLDALSVADKAALRLLVRADAATASQLARLIYRRQRTAQDRLLSLWRSGALERSTDPRSGRGTAAYAYRTSQSTRAHLGIREPRASSLYLRHTLDIVEAVCALAVPDDAEAPYPVQAWLTERMSADLPGPGIRPDSVVALQLGDRSAVLCLEMDEGTQHAPVIRARLAAYGRWLPARAGWHLLFVVQSEQRTRWLRRLGSWHGPASLEGRSWVVRLTDLGAGGLNALAVPIVGREPPHSLRALATDPIVRMSTAPVGSVAWIELLGQGGGEDLDRALR
jgi:Replication-relaxation